MVMTMVCGSPYLVCPIREVLNSQPLRQLSSTLLAFILFNLSFVICTVSYPFYEQTLLCYLLPIVTADIITIPLRNKIKSNLSQAKREGRSHSWPKRSKLGERETGAGCRGRKGALIRASHCGGRQGESGLFSFVSQG